MKYKKTFIVCHSLNPHLHNKSKFTKDLKPYVERRMPLSSQHRTQLISQLPQHSWRQLQYAVSIVMKRLIEDKGLNCEKAAALHNLA